MGSDNLFHKRKAVDLKRPGSKRNATLKILIVCEGKKTEFNYFREAKDYYRRHTVDVEFFGSAPITIAQKAKELYLASRSRDAYDRVYCVFDKDAHPSYHQAIDFIKAQSPKNTFYAIDSVPCFEYWFLLHFIYSSKPYMGIQGSKSCGDLLQEDLKSVFPEYVKNGSGYFLQLLSALEDAKDRAARILSAATISNSYNPSTKVHELITFFQKMQ